MGSEPREIRYEVVRMMFDHRIIETDGLLAFNNWLYSTATEANQALKTFLDRRAPVPLSTLPTGSKAIVRSVSGRMGSRLEDLGFLPGTPIRVSEKRAPSGEPLAYELRGGTSCIRRVTASQIMVSPLGPEEPEGWFRHVESGRRRPDGDPKKEYINP